MTGPVLDELHSFVRDRAEYLSRRGFRLHKKRLRFSEIVDCAVHIYPSDPRGGIRELLESLYVPPEPDVHTCHADNCFLLPMVTECTIAETREQSAWMFEA